MYILFINLFFTPPKLQYIFWKIPKTYEPREENQKIVYYTRSHIKYTVNIVLNKIINFLFLRVTSSWSSKIIFTHRLLYILHLYNPILKYMVHLHFAKN